jgi:glyoxylate reductase
MAKEKVFVSRRIPEVGLQRIGEHCEVDLWPGELPPPPDVLRARAADCVGIVTLLTDRIDAAFLAACPRLRVVSNYAVGFNNIDVPAATARGVFVGNTPGVLTDATADIAFALLIAAARRLVEGHQYTLSGKWKTWEPLGHLGQDMAGRTLGIIGMGRIGYALARRCQRGWDMQVIYTDRAANEKADRELGARLVDFDTLLRQSDFISVHCDLNDQTRGLFGLAEFKKMKPTVVFVNTARGPVVQQAALAEALRSGTIFAAGLDVTDPEPPEMTDPLLQLPNVVIAPHIASATVGTRNAMAEMCAANLIAGVNGEPLPNCVNPRG